MDSSGSPAGGPHPEGGVLAALMALVGSLTRHLVALGGLARAEAEEALTSLLKILVYVVLGLIFAVFGYLLLLLFVAFLLEVVLGLSWIWTTLALALAHFALLGVCAWNVRAGMQTPMFTATMREVRRDIDILTRQHTTESPTTPAGSPPATGENRSPAEGGANPLPPSV